MSSIPRVFGSFFVILMIAASFAYYNYKFSLYKFIDFQDLIFYSKKDIFYPKDDKYLLVFFSSNNEDSFIKIKKMNNKYKILAIDFYQKKIESTNNIFFLRAGTNTILTVLRLFNIVNLPSYVLIKKYDGTKYKQDDLLLNF